MHCAKKAPKEIKCHLAWGIAGLYSQQVGRSCWNWCNKPSL